MKIHNRFNHIIKSYSAVCQVYGENMTYKVIDINRHLSKYYPLPLNGDEQIYMYPVHHLNKEQYDFAYTLLNNFDKIKNINEINIPYTFIFEMMNCVFAEKNSLDERF